jgi:hypothetical protein
MVVTIAGPKSSGPICADDRTIDTVWTAFRSACSDNKKSIRSLPQNISHRVDARVGFLCGVCGCMPASLALLLALGRQAIAFFSSGADWASIRPQGIAGLGIAVALALFTKLAAIVLARGLVFLELARVARRALRPGEAPSGARHE